MRDLERAIHIGFGRVAINDSGILAPTYWSTSFNAFSSQFAGAFEGDPHSGSSSYLSCSQSLQDLLSDCIVFHSSVRQYAYTSMLVLSSLSFHCNDIRTGTMLAHCQGRATCRSRIPVLGHCVGRYSRTQCKVDDEGNESWRE